MRLIRCSFTVLGCCLVAGCVTQTEPLTKTGDGILNGQPYRPQQNPPVIIAGEPIVFEAQVTGGQEPYWLEVFGPTGILLASVEGSIAHFGQNGSGKYRFELFDLSGARVGGDFNLAVLVVDFWPRRSRATGPFFYKNFFIFSALVLKSLGSPVV